MRMFRVLAMLGLPLVAVNAVASFAAANDNLIAYLGGPYQQGAYWYDCLLTGGGKRAHVQARAHGELNYGAGTQNVYSVQAGTSQSSAIGPNGYGKRHRAYLESHLLVPKSGIDTTKQHCSSGWTAGWISSGTSTNIGSCSSNLYAAGSETGGTCSPNSFNAQSMGSRD